MHRLLSIPTAASQVSCGLIASCKIGLVGSSQRLVSSPVGSVAARCQLSGHRGAPRHRKRIVRYGFGGSKVPAFGILMRAGPYRSGRAGDEIR
jgi:hypothetical protein